MREVESMQGFWEHPAEKIPSADRVSGARETRRRWISLHPTRQDSGAAVAGELFSL